MFIVLALPLEEYKKKNHQGPEQFHWAPGSNLKFDKLWRVGKFSIATEESEGILGKEMF